MDLADYRRLHEEPGMRIASMNTISHDTTLRECSAQYMSFYQHLASDHADQGEIRYKIHGSKG